MKSLFALLVITVLAIQYANAGSLRPRLRRDADDEKNRNNTMSLVADVVNLAMHVPIVSQWLSDLMNQWTSITIIIDDGTAGLFTGVLNACWSCLEENRDWNDCWEDRMRPMMCGSVSPMIKSHVNDPMLQPMLEFAITTAMKSTLKIC